MLHRVGARSLDKLQRMQGVKHGQKDVQRLGPALTRPQRDTTQEPFDSHSDRPNRQPLVREEGRKHAEHQTEFTPP